MTERKEFHRKVVAAEGLLFVAAALAAGAIALGFGDRYLPAIFAGFARAGRLWSRLIGALRF